LVLQAQSDETFDLPQWQKDHGFSDREKFIHYGPKLIELSGTPRNHILLYANWAYHPNHAWFRNDFPGLRFEAGHPKAGQKWYGETWEDATEHIESSFAQLASLTGTRYAPIGRAWLYVKQDSNHLVDHNSLFWDPIIDASHPSYKGAFLT